MAEDKVHYSFKTTDEKVIDIWNLAKMKKKVLIEEALIYYYENHKNISGLFEIVEDSKSNRVEPKENKKIDVDRFKKNDDKKDNDLTWKDI